MQDVLSMREYQFKDALSQVTTPQLVFDNADRIYDYLVELFDNPMASDSVLREWAFQYSTENLGIKYDDIYNKWLKEDYSSVNVASYTDKTIRLNITGKYTQDLEAILTLDEANELREELGKRIGDVLHFNMKNPFTQGHMEEIYDRAESK